MLHLLLNRYFISNKIGNNLIIRINPDKVNYYVGVKWQTSDKIRSQFDALPMPFRSYGRKVVRRLHKYEPFFYNDVHFQKKTLIEKNNKFLKTKSAIIAYHNNDPKDSFWYHELIKEVETVGYAKHKNFLMHNKNDVINFFYSYFFPLIESFTKHGFSDSRTSDYGTCVIDKDLNILKSSAAMHRFSLTKELGIKEFPLKIIGINRSVYNSAIRNKAENKNTLELLSDLIRKIEHAHR